ncbi:MAG: glycosyltransferase family 4 protein [Myxococcales bacterium]|nr:glycosyltransferase family 4 protein [Myxococcales bacterium]
MTGAGRGRPSVLVVTKTARLGGAERVLMNALPYLDRDRFRYRFSALDTEGPLADAVQEAGLRFAPLPSRRAFHPRNFAALRRAAKNGGIDLVHAHLPLVGCLSRAAFHRRVPLIYTEHNLQDSYHPASRWLNSRTYRWQRRVIAVSDEVSSSAFRHVGRHAAERVQVIPNGVDFERLDREARRPPGPLPGSRIDALRVLVPGTLARRKGQDVLLDALSFLGDSAPALTVWMAGDGPLEGSLRRRLASRPELAARVEFLGRRSDIFAVMRAADVLVMPSRYEGHPLALLEGLALGKACIATRVGGVPEIVTSGHNGLLIAPENPGALASALRQMACDPALRRRLGQAAAREVRARFDIRDTVRAWERVYEETLGEEPALTDRRASARRSSRWRGGSRRSYPRRPVPNREPTDTPSPPGCG